MFLLILWVFDIMFPISFYKHECKKKNNQLFKKNHMILKKNPLDKWNDFFSLPLPFLPLSILLKEVNIVNYRFLIYSNIYLHCQLQWWIHLAFKYYEREIYIYMLHDTRYLTEYKKDTIYIDMKIKLSIKIISNVEKERKLFIFDFQRIW